MIQFQGFPRLPGPVISFLIQLLHIRLMFQSWLHRGYVPCNCTGLHAWFNRLLSWSKLLTFKHGTLFFVHWGSESMLAVLLLQAHVVPLCNPDTHQGRTWQENGIRVTSGGYSSIPWCAAQLQDCSCISAIILPMTR